MQLDPVTLTALQTIALILMLVGLVGTLVPIMPDLIIIWAPALIYGLVTGFNWLSGILFALMTVLMIFGYLIDNVIMGQKARQQGASWWAIAVSLIGGVVGSIIFPPFGGLIVALVGLFAVEFFRLRNWRQAFASTRSMALGCGWAMIVRFGVGVVMIFLWLAWVKWG